MQNFVKGPTICVINVLVLKFSILFPIQTHLGAQHLPLLKPRNQLVKEMLQLRPEQNLQILQESLLKYIFFPKNITKKNKTRTLPPGQLFLQTANMGSLWKSSHFLFSGSSSKSYFPGPILTSPLASNVYSTPPLDSPSQDPVALIQLVGQYPTFTNSFPRLSTPPLSKYSISVR